MTSRTSLPLLLLSVFIVACSAAPAGSDSGPVPQDASGSDAAMLDAAMLDAASIDASSVDGAVTDAPGLDAAESDGGGTLAARCVATGGTVATGLCCGGTSDFPSSCVTGACGCAPSSSHMVSICQCASGFCFDPLMGCMAR